MARAATPFITTSPIDDLPYVATCAYVPEILYDGEVYSHVDTQLETLNWTRLTVVVPQPDEDENDQTDNDSDDAQREGPLLIIFNRGVYQKSFLDPALVSDTVLRTVLFSSPKVQDVPAIQQATSYPEYPSYGLSNFEPPARFLPEMDSSHETQLLLESTDTGSSSYRSSPSIVRQPLSPMAISQTSTVLPSASNQPIPAPRKKTRATRTSMNIAYLAGFLAARATSAPGSAINNMPHPVPTRTMPPRAAEMNPEGLEYGFDLPASLRVQMNFQVPLMHNYYYDANGVMQKLSGQRITWDEEHKVYAWELVQFAMLSLNRELRHTDYRVITEALHRRFQGTRNAKGKLYTLRGFNTVHSMVVKHPAYEEFVRTVLP